MLLRAPDDARDTVVGGDVVVGLVPHSLGSALLADLRRRAREPDGGRILGARLVCVRCRLVGRVGAE